uniref:Uncharacterized protein n=1 Tax=mine drainage metagenome TaxID=410659 RepID=E6QIA1_9ZZZZ
MQASEGSFLLGFVAGCFCAGVGYGQIGVPVVCLLSAWGVYGCFRGRWRIQLAWFPPFRDEVAEGAHRRTFMAR